MSLAERRRREARGRFAETVAALWLRARGYRILARRARTPLGELDIVARRGRVLAIVEVKARAGADEALAAVTPRQQERIARAALWFAHRHPAAVGLDLRFDVLAVRPGRLPRHLRDAWRSPGHGF